MFRKIVFLTVFVSFPLITSANIPEDIKERYLATVRRGKANKNYMPPVNPSPPPIQLITDNPLWSEMCACNKPGNYQNPFNCNEFIMCAGPLVFLAQCPLGTGSYSPIADLCGYIQPPPAETCPWRSIWTYPDGVSCKTLGQRPWWGDLTFPANPAKRCGREIVYCNNYQQTGTGLCKPGFGYSKAYLACLEYGLCNYYDAIFGL